MRGLVAVSHLAHIAIQAVDLPLKLPYSLLRISYLRDCQDGVGDSFRLNLVGHIAVSYPFDERRNLR